MLFFKVFFQLWLQHEISLWSLVLVDLPEAAMFLYPTGTFPEIGLNPDISGIAKYGTIFLTGSKQFQRIP